MFGLIRRFSGSIVPRPDRTWNEDATSNAPRVGSKRRMADEDRDEDEDEQARLKKVRGATTEAQADAPETSSAPPPKAAETADVKEVTKGVKQVDLEEKPLALPESIPLPEEKAGELDADASSTASTPPPTGETTEKQDTAVVVPAESVVQPSSAEGVSEKSETLSKDSQAPTDTSESVTDSAAAPVVGETNARRPMKKLPAKPRSSVVPAPAEPAESTGTES
ncbi:hypothetical protein R3P38DRAFT_2970618 [Favolaschia claudopus]|uniref:Uncharacterized protein n=1 Tax=Favolaschia claudopus TaxID=2862362 RepID=A0AAW0B2D4_9AGAR